jgi:hypothetical protein
MRDPRANKGTVSYTFHPSFADRTYARIRSIQRRDYGVFERLAKCRLHGNVAQKSQVLGECDQYMPGDIDVILDV